MDPGLYRLDVDTPVLIFRDEPGLLVEVPASGSSGIAFRQAPLRFDLFASGIEMNAVSDRKATRSLVVALPADWLSVHQDLPGDPIGLDSRFQFADDVLRRLVWRLTMHHRHGEPLGAAYSGAVSRTIVDRLLRLQLAGEARRPDAAGLDAEARRLVEALVDDNLPDPPSAAAMASRLGITTARFVRAFKVAFGATPHQYVQRRRLQRARELLRGSDAPLTTIALETGFASHAHFSAAFRARTGVTPSHYRRTGAEATAC